MLMKEELRKNLLLYYCCTIAVLLRNEILSLYKRLESHILGQSSLAMSFPSTRTSRLHHDLPFLIAFANAKNDY